MPAPTNPNGQPAEGFAAPPTPEEVAAAAAGFDLRAAPRVVDTSTLGPPEPAAAAAASDITAAAGSLQDVPPELLRRPPSGVRLDEPPPPPRPAPPSVSTDYIAWRMVNSPYSPEQATEALNLARRTGMSPQL